jgi:hypothetical protein
MKKITMNDIYNLEDNRLIDYDINYRGGKYGISLDDFINNFMPDNEDIKDLLPNKIGVYCNYLGGGLRGSICKSDFSEKLPEKYAKIVDSFTELCCQRYLEIEDEMELNEEGEGEEINWEARGTNKCRNAGIVSNY